MLEVLKTDKFWNLNAAAHSPGSRNCRVTYAFSTILTPESSTRVSDG